MKNQFYFLVFFSFIALLTACRTTEEGCIDPTARNFNASADKDCKCCTFYKAQLITQHYALNSNDSFIIDATFFDPQNTALIAKKAVLLISDLQLIDMDGNLHSIEDTINAEFMNGVYANLPNSFGIASPTQSILDMGKFYKPGIYKGFRFKVGLTQAAREINRTTVRPTTHVLGTAATLSTFDSLSMQQYSYMLDIVKGQDTFQLKSTVLQEIELIGDIEIRDRFDANVSMSILWARLFENIDWDNDSINTMQQKIDNNLAHIFVFSI